MAEPLRFAINGFGRIGRLALRLALDEPRLQCVAINDIAHAEILAHLFKYDSVHGRFPRLVQVNAERGVLSIGEGDSALDLAIFSQVDPAGLPWAKSKVDVVLECTGRFKSRNDAARHLTAGAKRVIISAPGKDVDASIVMGVNDDSYDPVNHVIIDTASCTTNCFAPMVMVLYEQFGIERGLMTTVHAYTGDQRITDAPHKDLRRARAAALSMIPTSTGAARAIVKIFPDLEGSLDAVCVRVPTPDCSLVDFTAELICHVTPNDINEVFRQAASEKPLSPYLRFLAEDEPLVSADFIGDRHSCIFDSGLTRVTGNSLVKVFGWYDNEMGYAARMVDVLKLIESKY